MVEPVCWCWQPLRRIVYTISLVQRKLPLHAQSCLKVVRSNGIITLMSVKVLSVSEDYTTYNVLGLIRWVQLKSSATDTSAWQGYCGSYSASQFPALNQMLSSGRACQLDNSSGDVNVTWLRCRHAVALRNPPLNKSTPTYRKIPPQNDLELPIWVLRDFGS